MPQSSKSHELKFSVSALRFIQDLHPPLKERIANALLEIARKPRAGKPLKGDLKGNSSYRAGDWRVIYSLGKSLVYIKDIRHRREVYRRK
jgi:mRNA-degrading endonuclease RelE of RelBE toxin-antitoxin system